MKKIPSPLFQELCSQTCRIATGWLITRADGTSYGFTSSDIEFTLDGVLYLPANGFNPSAVVSKADFSVDNMEMQVLDSPVITEADLKGGKWANAQVNVFWLCPEHPEWGVVPLRGGLLGEIVVKTGQWTTQLRSLFQQMQQPLGVHFTIVCNAQLGDARCGVKLNAPAWQPNHAYQMGLLSDAKIGDVVQPTVPNDFWYVAQYTTESFWTPTGGQGEGAVVLVPLGAGAGGGTVTETGGLTTGSGYISNIGGLGAGGGYGYVNVSPSQNVRTPTQPGQGLSANDDLGPNDNTQVAVGAAPDNLGQFDYTGTPVDIFGIKL